MNIRKSPISGSWYSGTESGLKQQIEKLMQDLKFGLGNSLDREKFTTHDNNLVGAIVPHAGLMYSGYTAIHSYAELYFNLPKVDLIIILGPNHTGIGSPISFSRENWETPFGIIEIDNEIVDFTENFNFSISAKFDENAHTREHSIEIQLPFLQYIYKNDFKFFPICMLSQYDYPEIAKFIIALIGKFTDKKIAIVASSDLSHEEDYNRLMKNDQKMIDLITNGDTDEALKFKKLSGMTMCGYGPVFTLMKVVEYFNGNFKFINYTNSSQITDNYSKNQYRVGYSAFGTIIK